MNKNYLIIGLSLVLVITLITMGTRKPQPITQNQEVEIILKKEIAELNKEIQDLKELDSVKDLELVESKKKEKIASKKVAEIDKQYEKAVEATDKLPDSTNLSNEVRESRKKIVAQEGHINALLDVVEKGDERIKSQADIIKSQDIQLINWETRFDNMVEQKDGEIKQEKKRGNKKFFRGMGVGATVATVVIFIL
jgi:hypothetical protein